MVRVEPDGRTMLTKTSAADCFQVRSISDTRFVKRIGHVDQATMEKVREGLAAVLSIHI
jgi:mRNA interferase MazF